MKVFLFLVLLGMVISSFSQSISIDANLCNYMLSSRSENYTKEKNYRSYNNESSTPEYSFGVGFNTKELYNFHIKTGAQFAFSAFQYQLSDYDVNGSPIWFSHTGALSEPEITTLVNYSYTQLNVPLLLYYNFKFVNVIGGIENRFILSTSDAPSPWGNDYNVYQPNLFFGVSFDILKKVEVGVGGVISLAAFADEFTNEAVQSDPQTVSLHLNRGVSFSLSYNISLKKHVSDDELLPLDDIHTEPVEIE